MLSGRRPQLFACLLSCTLLAAVYWHLKTRQQDQEQKYREMAWPLRRPDSEQGLTLAQKAFLAGRYEEALRALHNTQVRREQALRDVVVQCLLRDVKWPAQVLNTLDLDPEGNQKAQLLARVTQSGYAKDSDRVNLEVFSWDGKRLRPLGVSAQSPDGKSAKPLREWRQIKELKVVHLERKDAKLPQLWVAGQEANGRYRLELIYGLKQWHRLVVRSEREPQLASDRIRVPGGPEYKLVDDEWITIRR